MLAHNWCGSDSYLFSKNLPQGKTVVSLIENRSGIVFVKKFNGYVDQNKKKILNMYILDVEASKLLNY